jgi:hypothetical protein
MLDFSTHNPNKPDPMKRQILFVTSVAALLAALPLLAADVRNGLVAYWPMNTAPGSGAMTTPDVVAANDLQGPTKDGTTALVAGKFGSAVTFTGNTLDYLYLLPVGDTGLPVAKQGSWTYCVWVNGPAAQLTQSTYFGETTSTSASSQWRFSMESDGTTKTRTWIRDAGGGTKISAVLGNTNTLDSTWHHIAYTYDISTSTFKMYVDGEPISTNTFTYAQNSSSFNQIAVGALVRTTVAVPFTGAVDDLALWSRPLSKGEIQDVMTNSIATPIPAFAPTVTANPIGSTNLYEGDNFTLSGSSFYGTRPFSYQWLKDGTNYPGGNDVTLPLSNVTSNDNGQYRLVVSNTGGSATSAVAQVTVKYFGSPNLTNGIVAYWPLDTITGVKTPDLVSAYDLTVGGTVNPTLTSGKWGNGMSFSAASSQYATRLDNAGEALPAYSLPDFTVSLWVKAAPSAAATYFFGDASTANTLPCFLLGTPASSSDKVYAFVRNDGGTTVTPVSTSVLLDDTWHNVVWVQHNAGGTAMAKWYIDGVLDDTTPSAVYPLTANRTTLGCFFRTAGQGFFTGALDEVVVWQRSLSAAEVALLQTSYITNPPSRLTPLVVNSFMPDLPAVASGDSTVLRWDVPGNATQVLLSGLGDVTAKTVGGLGSTNLSPSVLTDYVLTVKRGAEEVKATNRIGVVSGVATNWHLLDNFDFYSPGDLASRGWWVDAGSLGNSVSVVTPTSSNRLVKTMTTLSAAYLRLNNLTVNSNQSSTLFFRMIPRATDDVATTRNIVGITDRQGSREYQFNSGNMGPAVYPAVNDPAQNPGDWLIAAYDMPASALTYATNILETNVVYNVWIDVTNVPVGDGSYPGHEDMFSVYLQKEGDAERTCILTNFTSDRDNVFSDTFTPLATDPLKLIFLTGNRTDQGALFDDFYLSKSGYNATIPRAVGYAGPAPTLQLQWSGSQWQILFQGSLEAASAVSGTYTNVPGATSPYPITTSEALKFYRAVYY